VSGHGVCDDGLVIDLAPMKGIHVDPKRRIARAEPGLTSGEFLRETQKFGLAIPTGVFSSVGISGPLSSIVFYQIHGTVMRVDPDATAFAQRHDHYILEMIAQWAEDEAQPHMEWVHRFGAAIKPFASEGVYVNFLTEEGEARIRASYGLNYERLVQIKNRYDPTNFFHINQNIKPTR
jgi:FAD/FMN-containing dehydrogenase